MEEEETKIVKTFGPVGLDGDLEIEPGRWYWYEPLGVPMMALYPATSDGSVWWVLIPRIHVGSMPKLIMDTIGECHLTDLLGKESPY